MSNSSADQVAPALAHTVCFQLRRQGRKAMLVIADMTCRPFLPMILRSFDIVNRSHLALFVVFQDVRSDSPLEQRAEQHVGGQGLPIIQPLPALIGVSRMITVPDVVSQVQRRGLLGLDEVVRTFFQCTLATLVPINSVRDLRVVNPVHWPEWWCGRVHVLDIVARRVYVSDLCMTK